MRESRTTNVLRNVRTGAVVQIINKLMAFLVRTIFIKSLNTEYLGINGLFTNILTILSLAELGIGTAIIFNMYKPVAENDIKKITCYMNLYRESYNIIGLIVFAMGVLLIPFMDFIVKDIPNIQENIIMIYLLFLFNTASSYFFSYKKSIIIAHQKQSIIDNIDSIFYLVKSFLEIIILITTNNFMLYLIIQIIGTFIENIIISRKANKMYPYLKENKREILDKVEKKNVFKNVKSLVVYKLGVVVMTGTDNILISSLINVNTVGLCSNYTLIINSIKTIVTTTINGVTASIGNLNAGNDVKKKEDIFYQFTFINYIIYSFCAVAFVILLNPFIKLWLGEMFVLDILLPIALALTFFIDGIRSPGYIYRTTLGLFEKGKVTPYIGAIVNVFLSIFLCKFLGVSGIFFATGISQLVSYFWIDPYLIHKYEFKTSPIKYFKKVTKYFVVLMINIIICIMLSRNLKFTGIFELIIKTGIVVVIPNIVNYIVFYKTEEFKMLKKRFINSIVERNRRGNNEEHLFRIKEKK